MRPDLGPPATLGTTLTAGLDLWGDCLGCRRHVHLDTALFDLIARLTCAECGSRLGIRVHVPRLAKFGGRA